MPACERLLEAKFEVQHQVADSDLEGDTKAVAEALEELAALLSRVRAS